jgi:hypothetical protein
MMLSPKGSVGACIPTGVFAFLPCAFAAHEDDVVQDVDAEKLPGLHQAPGQGAVFLARLGCPRWMVMTAHERGGIAEDGGLHDFAGMDDAGGQRPDRHGVDADDLVFLIQHGHQEVFAVHGAEVLAEENRGIPGTADLGVACVADDSRAPA